MIDKKEETLKIGKGFLTLWAQGNKCKKIKEQSRCEFLEQLETIGFVCNENQNLI